MSKLHYNSSPDAAKHECEAHKIGDWIVYDCPQCDYELKKNLKTGELFVQNAKTNISHAGGYAPPRYKQPAWSLN